VKAGPYRLDLADERTVLTYREYDPQPRIDQISWDANFRLSRPPGPWKEVRLVLNRPSLKAGMGSGTIFSPLSDPKPNELDVISYQNAVPVGWRAERLDLTGETQEVEGRSFEAVFRRVEVVPQPFEARRRSDYFLRVPEEETVTLADGVEVTFAAQPEATSRLPLTIRYDPRRLLPHVPTRAVELWGLTTNVGSTTGSVGSVDANGEIAVDFWLDRDARQEKDAKELRVRFRLQKVARRFPFKLPLDLKWPPTVAKPRS